MRRSRREKDPYRLTPIENPVKFVQSFNSRTHVIEQKLRKFVREQQEEIPQIRPSRRYYYEEEADHQPSSKHDFNFNQPEVEREPVTLKTDKSTDLDMHRVHQTKKLLDDRRRYFDGLSRKESGELSMQKPSFMNTSFENDRASTASSSDKFSISMSDLDKASTVATIGSSNNRFPVRQGQWDNSLINEEISEHGFDTARSVSSTGYRDGDEMSYIYSSDDEALLVTMGSRRVVRDAKGTRINCPPKRRPRLRAPRQYDLTPEERGVWVKAPGSNFSLEAVNGDVKEEEEMSSDLEAAVKAKTEHHKVLVDFELEEEIEKRRRNTRNANSQAKLSKSRLKDDPEPVFDLEKLVQLRKEMSEMAPRPLSPANSAHEVEVVPPTLRRFPSPPEDELPARDGEPDTYKVAIALLSRRPSPPRLRAARSSASIQGDAGPTQRLSPVRQIINPDWTSSGTDRHSAQSPVPGRRNSRARGRHRAQSPPPAPRGRRLTEPGPRLSGVGRRNASPVAVQSTPGQRIPSPNPRPKLPGRRHPSPDSRSSTPGRLMQSADLPPRPPGRRHPSPDRRQGSGGLLPSSGQQPQHLGRRMPTYDNDHRLMTPIGQAQVRPANWFGPEVQLTGRRNPGSPLPPPRDPDTPPSGRRNSDHPAPGRRALNPPAPGRRAADPPAPGRRTADQPAPGRRASEQPAPGRRAADPPPPGRRNSGPPAPGRRNSGTAGSSAGQASREQTGTQQQDRDRINAFLNQPRQEPRIAFTTPRPESAEVSVLFHGGSSSDSSSEDEGECSQLPFPWGKIVEEHREKNGSNVPLIAGPKTAAAFSMERAMKKKAKQEKAISLGKIEPPRSGREFRSSPNASNSFPLVVTIPPYLRKPTKMQALMIQSVIDQNRGLNREEEAAYRSRLPLNHSQPNTPRVTTYPGHDDPSLSKSEHVHNKLHRLISEEYDPTYLTYSNDPRFLELMEALEPAFEVPPVQPKEAEHVELLRPISAGTSFKVPKNATEEIVEVEFDVEQMTRALSKPSLIL